MTPSCFKPTSALKFIANFGDKHEIIRKFAGTHSIIEISPSVRKAQVIPVGPFDGIDVLRASDERRSLQTNWLFLEVRADSGHVRA
jgi:hypothetical protein